MANYIELLPEEVRSNFTDVLELGSQDSSVGVISPTSLVPNLPSMIRPRGEWILLPGNEDEDYGTIDRVLVAVHGRQGGGNDECWCEIQEGEPHDHSCLWQNNQLLRDHPCYVRDDYDSFDSTYITFLFDAGTTDEELSKYHEQKDFSNRVADASIKYRLCVDNPNVPIWLVFSGRMPSELEKFRRSSLETTNSNISFLERERDVWTRLLAHDFTAIPDIPRKGGMYGSNSYRIEQLPDILDKIASREKELAVSKAMYEQAQTLPDGVLKDYLLGDRGVGSYRVSEGRGRNKRTITKKYNKGSLLGSRVEDDTRHVITAKEGLDSSINYLEKHIRDTIKDIDVKIKKYREEMVSASDLWAIGWDSNWGPVPTMPSEWTP